MTNLHLLNVLYLKIGFLTLSEKEKLKNKENLTFEESKSAFEILMTGKADEDQIYNFLTLLW